MMKKTLALASLAVVLIVYGLWQLSSARSFQAFGHLVSQVATSEPVVALTFDDGPTQGFTGDVLAILRERQVNATFFVTGREVDDNLVQAQQILVEGHELGNHSYSHPRMVFKSPGFIRDEIERTDAAIRRAGYDGEILFRPPYGKKLFALPWYLRQTNRTTIMWDIEPETYPEIADSAQAIADHVLARVKPGSIVLLHVMYKSRQASRDALPLIIDGLREKGYRLVTLSELLQQAPPP